MALATFEQLQNFLELNKTKTITDYPTLEILIDSMQSVFESYSSRLFDFQPHTETFRVSDPAGESIFWLKGTPIDSLTSVTLDGESLSLTDDLTFSLQDVELNTSAERGSEVQIIYVGGLNPIPADIILASIQQIAFQFQNRGHLAVTSLTLNDDSKKLPELDLLTGTKRILDKYRNYGPGF